MTVTTNPAALRNLGALIDHALKAESEAKAVELVRREVLGMSREFPL